MNPYHSTCAPLLQMQSSSWSHHHTQIKLSGSPSQSRRPLFLSPNESRTEPGACGEVWLGRLSVLLLQVRNHAADLSSSKAAPNLRSQFSMCSPMQVQQVAFALLPPDAMMVLVSKFFRAESVNEVVVVQVNISFRFSALHLRGTQALHRRFPGSQLSHHRFSTPTALSSHFSRIAGLRSPTMPLEPLEQKQKHRKL